MVVVRTYLNIMRDLVGNVLLEASLQPVQDYGTVLFHLSMSKNTGILLSVPNVI